ncbi:hypothetical protein [Rhizobium sp. BK376]|uniref:hypothetical protein n=1 Tax=Rhizobium sp. BK376 TaxID=2512149 RepID=UPI001045AD0C|nr:hypothetical protein [Rhizobium sp. BK376]TCR75630.1 hypothetical protein EV561_12269 [Rhizobium sp. BK376]
MLRIQLCAIAAAMVASSAVAASEYYVEHAPNSKTCMVSEMKPDGKKTIEVSGGHKTKAEAEAAMKASSKCAH